MKEHQEKVKKVLWFTGLSASGKTALSKKLYDSLIFKKIQTARLDGDILRDGLSKDLGFSEKDRGENIRRAAELAKILSQNGLITLCAFISPFNSARELARKIIGPENFIEIFVDTPIEECERRDPKGLYKKARAGEIKEFTGISSPYEPPENPDIHIKTLGQSEAQSIAIIESALKL